MDTVRINLKGVVNARLADLNPFQDDIKILDEDNYQRMKAEILEDGFSFSPHVFIDDDGKLWLLDGHQRRSCLDRMQKEGFEIPTIPCMEVEAESLEHARRLVLAAASQYGTFQPKKVINFMKAANLDAAAMTKRFSLPEAVQSRFKTVTFTAGTKDEQGKLGEKKPVKCPACSHEFVPS